MPVPPLPHREACSTTWLSKYRRVWFGSEWELFLRPTKGGFSLARVAPQCFSSTNTLMDQPGVYELALVKGKDLKRYKIYVGQSCSLRRRFHQEYRGSSGSHLRPFFDEALLNDCQIWRRCRYTANVEEARTLEAWLLKQYDYAWNIRQAGCKARHVDIVTQQCCCSKSTHLLAKPIVAKVHSIQVTTG